MRTALFAIAAGAAVSLFNPGAAHAQNYPFCLKNDAGPGDCKYDTYQQCLEAASGAKGYCQPNYWLPQNRGAPVAGRWSRANRAYGQQY